MMHDEPIKPWLSSEKRQQKARETLDPTPPSLPDWLTMPDPVPPKPSALTKALLITQYEMVFPRVLELISSGYTLAKALRDIPIPIDSGAFLRWIKKDPKNHDLYKEAKEIRTEAWAGKIIEHASGEKDDGTLMMEDVARSKLVVDTYKWLMGADNRKQYGDTKTIDVTGGISITAALQQAQARVAGAIDAEFTEVVEPLQISEGDDDE